MRREIEADGRELLLQPFHRRPVRYLGQRRATLSRVVAKQAVLAAAARLVRGLRMTQQRLDGAEAREILTSNRYRAEVQAAEQKWLQSGINSVPSVVINEKYLISGGQTAAVFEDSLRRIAAE